MVRMKSNAREPRRAGLRHGERALRAGRRRRQHRVLRDGQGVPVLHVQDVVFTHLEALEAASRASNGPRTASSSSAIATAASGCPTRTPPAPTVERAVADIDAVLDAARHPQIPIFAGARCRHRGRLTPPPARSGYRS